VLHILHSYFGNKHKLEELVDYSRTPNQGSEASTPLQKASL